jgi:hypothetical protein
MILTILNSNATAGQQEEELHESWLDITVCI